jgi:hypothetical protein
VLTSRGLPASRFGLAHSFVEKKSLPLLAPRDSRRTELSLSYESNDTGSRAQNLFLTNFYNYFLGAAFKKSHGIFRE